MRAGLVRRKSPDLAIDLGTSHSRIADRAGEVVADVPSVVAFQSGNSERTAIIGEDAHRMLGRAPPGTTVSKPIEHGIVSDFHATEVLLKQLLRRCKLRPLQKPKLLISVPSNIQSTLGQKLHRTLNKTTIERSIEHSIELDRRSIEPCFKNFPICFTSVLRKKLKNVFLLHFVTAFNFEKRVLTKFGKRF